MLALAEAIERGFSVKLLQNYIDGRFVSGGREFADINPADGSVVAQVSEADRAAVDEAVTSARRRSRREWACWPVAKRAEMLHKIADGIEARFDGFSAGGSCGHRQAVLACVAH